MNDKNNSSFFLAVALSVVIMLAWQLLYVYPKLEQEKHRKELAAEAQKNKKVPDVVDGTPKPAGSGSAAAVPGTAVSPAPAAATREASIIMADRVAIETPAVHGSISLTGGRIDDVVLKHYQETIDKGSPNVVLFSPAASPHPYFSEFGWVTADSKPVVNEQTRWKQVGTGALAAGKPVVLEAESNGLLFHRTISIDDNYMFQVSDEVENKGAAAVSLFRYALIRRSGVPKTEGTWILHEGIIGQLGASGRKEVTFATAAAGKSNESIKDKTGWFGLTDKYWAAVLIPDQETDYEAHLTGQTPALLPVYQVDYLSPALSVAAGAKATISNRLFVGAKQVKLIDTYEADLKLAKFNGIIDWGWFYYIMRALFYLIDYIYKLVGNFGFAILIVTVLVKMAFFPLANKSYESMSKMKKLQPEMKAIQERFPDDKARQQQETMKLYKEHGANPLAGCVPVLLQIPVFFALYKVLFTTIEMRHAPFIGWIHDLSAPDPTTIFNLFGLIPWSPPAQLMIGFWPLVMGFTMWMQMKLNPAPADPVQQKIFAWMPVIFTYMMAPFSAGLIIYWSWNNFLSIVQQSIIMRRNGVKVEIFDNLKKDVEWLVNLVMRRGKKA